MVQNIERWLYVLKKLENGLSKIALSNERLYVGKQARKRAQLSTQAKQYEASQ